MAVSLGVTLGTSLGGSLGVNLAAQAGATVSDPSALIATADRVAWFKSDTGVTSASSRVSAWANQWGNGDLVQATGSGQPLITSSVFGSLPAVQADDTSRRMTATLSTPIAIGSRYYVWVYAKSAAAVTGTKHFVCVGGNAAAPFLQVSVTATTWRALFDDANSSTATLAPTTPAIDTVAHLFEAGFTTGGANAYVISGTGVSSTVTTAIAAAATRVFLCTNTGGTGTAVVGSTGEIVVTSREPSAQLKQNMRAYFLNRYGSI